LVVASGRRETHLSNETTASRLIFATFCVGGLEFKLYTAIWSDLIRSEVDLVLIPRLFSLLLTIFSVLPFLLAQRSGADGRVDFQRVVRPILSDACFHCHGPDRNTRMADLRLDTKEGSFEVRAAGTVIVPGNPSASLMIQRVMAKDGARRMPPEYSHKTLTDQQKELLKQWIGQGADWKEHWSFAPQVRSTVPEAKDKSWVRTPIDQFILAKLEAAGLEPAPEADRQTLIRRLSLDLKGLPPEPAEVEGFLKDDSANAYENLVDRLLSSKDWGEHRARYWLDAARYADTHGIHVDNYREMWPYRNWVIAAFNRNLPFDRFTIEQIAGDLLPNRTMEQQIASGFQRCNVTTNEGGVIAEEVEAMYAKDRADTTGMVWMGLTVGCASCHDHKFDPISQKDFYSFTAFFRNTTQDPMDGNVSDTPPILVVPKEQDKSRWLQLNEELSAVKSRMQQKREHRNKPFERWLDSPSRRSLASPVDPGSQLLHLSVEHDVRVTTKEHERSIELSTGLTLGPGATENRTALHFGKEASLELPHVDYFAADKPFSIAVWVYQPTGSGNFALMSQTDPKDQSRGWTIGIGARTPSLRLIGDGGKQIEISAGFQQQLKPGTWNHLVVTYDGSRELAGLGLFLNGRSIPTQHTFATTEHLKGEIRTSSPLRLGYEGSQENEKYFEGGAIADLRIYSRVLSKEEAHLAAHWFVMDDSRDKQSAQLSGLERDVLHLRFLNSDDATYRKMTARLEALLTEARAIRKRGAVTHVMEENRDTLPMAHILFRGQYDQPRDKVNPNVPAALPPMPASYPRNRQGLGQWLVSSANPLTARVTVNRFWQEVFGTGIVKTAEDFGSQGEAPSHPELLDWLAVEFRESKWDVKKLFKLMVTSSTYRQASVTSPLKLEKDPNNRLLSRGPRFRMDGEMVRDYALAASGLLSPLIGGPSVKPYQPEGVWETVAMTVSNTRFYTQDHGDKLYRRSLYTFWKRSAPPASMEIFNAPTREACTVRRERTNTPLQALVTMNDPQFVEAARSLAERAERDAKGDIDRQFDFITMRLLARPFEPNEREIAKRTYQGYLAYYSVHADELKKLLTIGESKIDNALMTPQCAALTMVTNQVLNLDEVLNK